jgi:phthalate 4,5-cis-dihydrodiol dehydrogenase
MSTINLGIAGLGRGFMLTLSALRAHPSIRLAGAFDLRADAVHLFAKEFGAEGHASLDALLSDPKIDAVYIATPHELHAEQSMAALRAGKHVLVEKPMATTVGECVLMTEAAKQAGKVLMIGPSHGFDEPVRVAAQAVASGRFGRMRLITSLNFTDFMYRPRRPEELDEARGGGVVYSQAAHQIDVVRRIVDQPTTAIRAVTGNWDPCRPSDGAYSALMTFESGAAASLTYSGYAHYDSDELVGWISELGQDKDPARFGDARRALASFSGEDELQAKLARAYGGSFPTAERPAPHHEHFGFLLISCEGADLKVLPTGIEVFADAARERIAIAPPAIPRAAVIEEFTNAMIGGHVASHDGRWGLETMACCAALIQSGRTGADADPRQIIREHQQESETSSK